MANKLRDEDLRLNIIVNGDQSRKEMIELAGSIQKTKQNVKLLEEENKKLKKSGQANSEQYKKNEADIKSLNTSLESQRAKLKELNDSIKLVDKTWGELGHEAKRVKRLLDQSVPGSEQWKKYDAELTAVKKRMAEVKGQSESAGVSFGKMTSGVGAMVGKIAVVASGVTAAVGSVMAGVSVLSELDDQLSGVMKTTGMTRAEVGKLSEELKTIDTRTSQEELLGLARVAGKLGISGEKDVLGFVRAADQIGVALGEDLGGTEEAVNSLGKLVDIFKLKDSYGLEDALLRTGSAINELGNAGTANEGYLVDFTNRMAGIAPAANISIEDILGLATVMDELGQPVEASATAIGQFIVGLGKDLPNMARIAGMSVQDFSDILEKDGNQALIAVLKNLKSTGQGVAGLARSMGLIGEDGARATTALGALSNNLELLEARQKLSNEQFEIGNSLTKEAWIQNNNLAANLEKLWNRVANSFKNSAMAEALNNFVASLVGSRVEMNNLTAAFETQQKKVGDLESTLPDLLATYEELQSKTNLSKKEQNDLRKAINGIAEAVPTAVTAYDSLGNAMGISTSKAREFLSMQREILKFQNKEAIAVTTTEIDKQLKSRAAAQRQLNNELSAGLPNAQRVAALQKNVVEKTKDLESLYDRIRGLNGGLLIPEVKTVAPTVTTGTTVDTSTLKTESELKAEESERKRREKEAKADRERLEKEAIRDFEKLNESYAKLGLTRLNDQLSKNEKEVAQEEQKYDLLIKEATDFLNHKGATDKQKQEAQDKIGKLETEKSLAVTNLRIRQEEEMVIKIKNLRTTLANDHASELQKEKDNINKFYDDLERDNTGNEIALSKLRIERQVELSNAELREKERLELEKKRIEDLYQGAGNKKEVELAAINSKYDAEIEALKIKYSKEVQLTKEFEALIAQIQGKRLQETQNLELSYTREKRDAGLQIAQMAADAMFAIGANNRRRETELALNEIEKQKAAELSNKNLTEAQREAIEEKYNERARQEKLKQWKADKSAALKQALINGALAVVKALPNFVLAGIAGAAALAQVITIKSEKPPAELEGKEDGGYLDAIRAQDKKKFRAKDTPGKRGYVDTTSVIVSESGKEFVANADAVENPSVRAVLDVIDVAQRNGSINTLKLEKMFSRSTRQRPAIGREEGGYLGGSGSLAPMVVGSSDPATLEVLRRATDVLAKLEARLKNPIKAEVAMLGKGGFVEKQEELEELEKLRNL